MKAKKCLAVLMAAALILPTIAVNAEEGGDDGETYSLVYATMVDPGSYGPYGTGGTRLPFTNILYEPLLSLNDQLEEQYVLMTGYEETSDGVYEVSLYDYIHDTEGNPVTASDVVFSYEKAEENGSYAQVLSSLVSVEAKDDYTVVFTLENERHNEFITMLASINIITEAAWEASGDDMEHNCVGTSPYRLVDYSEGSYVLYEKTNDYWQTDESLVADRSQSKVDTVRLDVISDLSATAIALENGEIDHPMLLNTADYGLFCNGNDDLTAKDGYVLRVEDSNVMYGMIFNCNEASPTSDINLRKAICTAIDVDAIVANVLEGYGQKVGNFVNPAYVDYDESMEHPDTYFPYSEEDAKAYVEASDYDGTPVKVLVGTNQNLISASVLIQAYLEAVGINCEIEQYETATYNSIRYSEDPTQWDILLVNEQPASAAADLWNIMYFADNSLYDFGNLQHFEDETYQELYEAMADKDTHSTESIQAFLDYTEENAYMYGMFYIYRMAFGSDHVISLALDDSGNLVCGGTEVKPD